MSKSQQQFTMPSFPLNILKKLKQLFKTHSHHSKKSEAPTHELQKFSKVKPHDKTYEQWIKTLPGSECDIMDDEYYAWGYMI